MTTITKNAILRSYDPEESRVPIDTLRHELLRKPALIHSTDPTRFEQLVQSVFSDFFKCEVMHCGGCGDGGVDLYFVLGAKPTIVQVKRRGDPKAVEAVAPIRELIGATVLQGVDQAIFVTTAKRFSVSAERAATTVLAKGDVTRFDLINRDRFFGMLHHVQDSSEPIWRRHLTL